MLTEIEKVLPSEIEKRSFEIIAEELGDKQLIPGTESIVKRCIHTSADFDYADNLIFSENVVEKALKAIRGGASIVTDTQMGKAGINKKCLAGYGGEVYCFMSDDDVAQAAKRPRPAVSRGSRSRLWFMVLPPQTERYPQWIGQSTGRSCGPGARRRYTAHSPGR